VAVAGVYVPGYVIFKSMNPITVLQTEPQLLTDKAWFNQKILDFKIKELHQIGADKIPPAFLNDRLYYYATFDTVYTVNEVVNSMKSESDVAFSEPNFIFQPLTGVDTNDPKAENMWGLKNIQMDRVWDELGVYGAPDIVVSVIDSGIDLGSSPYPWDVVNIHPDLLGNVWQAPEGNYGFNYYVAYPPVNVHVLDESVFYPHDKKGHGTSVSGVISAINNNEYAVSSVAGGWNGISAGTKIIPFRVSQLTASYLACYYAFLDSYLYGARIINFSLGTAESDMTQAGFDGMNMLHEIIIDMHNDTFGWGVRPLVIVAGGNDDSEQAYYPACFDEVLAVGAVDVYDKRGKWGLQASTLHSTIDIVAPGSLSQEDAEIDQVGIYTTFPTDVAQANLYHYTPIVDQRSGTSLAAPHVSGVAALVLSQFPALTNEQLRGRLVGTSDYIYNKNQKYFGLMGSGRLNAFRALTEPEQPNLVLNRVLINGISKDVVNIGATQSLSLELKNWWIDATDVWGTLTTDDPNITISYDGVNRFEWGYIPSEASLENVPLITINATGFNRVVSFTLTVNSANNAPKAIPFTLTLQTPLSGDLFCKLNLVNDILNKNFTVKDIDNDDFDEIFVTSRNGYLFIIQEDGSFTNVPLWAGTTCTPAVGDVNSDGTYDIVVGNNNGQVLVFSSEAPFNLTNTFNAVSAEIKPLITYITLEDMNNDGQLDIIAVYEKGIDGVGVNGFCIINMLDLQVYNYDTTYTIQHGVSVDDINNDDQKEVIFLCQNYNGLIHHQTDLYLNMVRVSDEFLYNQIYTIYIGNLRFDAGSSPIIADLNEDGVKDIAFRYDWDNQADPTFRSKKVGIKVYSYHLSNMELRWEYPGGNDCVSQIVQNDNIMIGNFADNDGLEILFSHNRLTLLDSNGFEVSSSGYLPEENNTYTEYLLSIDKYDDATKFFRLAGMPNNLFRLSAYTSDYVEDAVWRYSLDSDVHNDPIGMALIKMTPDTYGIVIPKQHGQIAIIPVNHNTKQIADYAKYRYNSLNTGSYYQPLPQEISNDTNVLHKLYVERDTNVEAELCLNPGIKVLIDPNKTISVYGSLRSSLNANNGVEFDGTCLNSLHGYWSGIVFKNRSESSLKSCSIQNALHGITYEYHGLHYLGGCSLEYNTRGLGIYHANPILKKNTIKHNTVAGIALNNRAQPYMGEDSVSAGMNLISMNPTGIFSSQSSPLLKQGHNDFNNYDFNIFVGMLDSSISAQRNWWSSFDPRVFEQKFNFPELIVYDPWDNAPNIQGQPEQNVFLAALQHMYEGQFTLAIPLFHQVLNDTVETEDDYTSISSLLVCYDKTNNLSSYRIFILEQLENYLSEKMQQTYKDCLALINRSLGFYSEALYYYEYKLENCSTFADSCYAVIDIGNTYLESNLKASGKYPHLRPKSISAHSLLSRNLLDLIYNNSFKTEIILPIENVILKQNYPNPFNPSTTLSFYLPEISNTQLTIYNIKGQVVKIVLHELMPKGTQTVVWDGKDANGRTVSSGVYFYQLKTDKSNIVRKCLLLK
jgi:subtilisin family serine protease